MGGGPNGYSTQQSITQQQLQLAQQTQNQSEQDRQQRQALMQPAIDFNQKLSSGDQTTTMQALQPLISNISKSYQSGKDQIYNNVAPGAARDFSLAKLERDKSTAIGDFTNQNILQSFDKLANMGSGIGSFSLQELGGAVNAFSGASGSNTALMQASAQNKASTMGFLGQLAGAAAMPFTFGGK